MHFKRILMVALVLAALVVPMSVQAKGNGPSSDQTVSGVSCGLPESNAEGLVILSNYYPGYW